MRSSSLKPLLAVTLASTVAYAQPTTTFNDVRDVPPDFLDTLETTLFELTEDLGLDDEVVDIVVVGSFAYGIARLTDDVRVSDLDVVLYMRTLSKDPAGHLAGFEAFRNQILRYGPIVRERLGAGIEVDIKVNTRDVNELIADPDWVGYSLLRRQFYNRADMRPRSVKGHFHNDRYYVFDRDAYMTYLSVEKRQRRRFVQVVDGNQLVFYDKQAWDRGEHVELLRSFPKVPGKRSDLNR